MRSFTPGPSFGLHSVTQAPKARPYLGGLDDAEGLEPRLKPLRADHDLLGLADQRLEPGHARSQRSGDLWTDEREGIARYQQSPSLGRLLAIVEQHAADLFEHGGVASEPAGQSKLGPKGTASSSGIRPQVGRMPRMPQ